MRLENLFIFALFFILAGLLSVLFSAMSIVMLFSYIILLDMIIGVFSLVLFIDYWRKSKRYQAYINRYLLGSRHHVNDFKVAVVIPVFNEEPGLVAETAVSAQFITNKPEDVYVLDDSTDLDIRQKLDTYSAEFGFSIVRRSDRKGYKAGAINNWLKTYGGNYDLVLILDADQRITTNSLDYIIGFFDDPNVSFVQVPQYYSELANILSASAYIQQIPFLRITMKGRHVNNSAFSLGSGTIYRIKHLLDIGGLYEESVTEDVATSIIIHSKNLKSVYLDLPLIWHGEAPSDFKSYFIQQNRWALGTFQALRLMLKEKIGAKRFLDYLNGFFYWLHTGPLTISNILAPFLFLVLGLFFLKFNPLNYILVYIPLFISSLTVYLLIMRRYVYGFKEFLLHQGIQLIASLPVTIAFLEWMLRRRAPFRRTPKGKQKRGLSPYYLFYVFLAIMLISSILIGVKASLHLEGPIKYAYIINLFWALWWLVLTSSSLYILTHRRIGKDLRIRISQSYEGYEKPVLDMLQCGARTEGFIANYYSDVIKRYPELEKKLAKLVEDSENHMKFYANLMKKLAYKPTDMNVKCRWFELIERKTRHKDEVQLSLESLLLLNEELKMRVYAKLVKEVCKHVLTKYEEDVIDKIINEELVHEEILKSLIAKTK